MTIHPPPFVFRRLNRDCAGRYWHPDVSAGEFGHDVEGLAAVLYGGGQPVSRRLPGDCAADLRVVLHASARLTGRVGCRPSTHMNSHILKRVALPSQPPTCRRRLAQGALLRTEVRGVPMARAFGRLPASAPAAPSHRHNRNALLVADTTAFAIEPRHFLDPVCRGALLA